MPFSNFLHSVGFKIYICPPSPQPLAFISCQHLNLPSLPCAPQKLPPFVWIQYLGSHDFLPSVFQQLHAPIFFQYLKFPLPVPLNSLHSCGFHPQILAVIYLPLCLFNNFLHSVGFYISISSIYLVSKSKLSPILPLQQLLAFIWIQYLDFPPGPPQFFAFMSFQNLKLPSPPVSTSVSLNNFLVPAFICFQYLNLPSPAAEHLHEHTSPISKASASTYVSNSTCTCEPPTPYLPLPP